jgi:hypothetical protein
MGLTKCFAGQQVLHAPPAVLMGQVSKRGNWKTWGGVSQMTGAR